MITSRFPHKIVERNGVTLLIPLVFINGTDKLRTLEVLQQIQGRSVT
jgi:hypothetical protein